MYSKRQLVWIVVAASLMGWGGAAIRSRLGLTIAAEVDFLLFVFGVVMMTLVPLFTIGARLRRIEAQLKIDQATANPIAAS